MLMAKAIDELAAQTPGKKSLAVEAFARALRQLPTILADNGGFDGSELVAQLRSAHTAGKSTYGLSTLTYQGLRPSICGQLIALSYFELSMGLVDMDNGTIADMRERGIVESFKLKRQVVSSATEAAEMILRVDNIIRAAPRYARALLVVFPC